MHTALALFEKHGLYSIDAVKGHRENFPVEEIQRALVDGMLGASVVFAATIRGLEFMALGWKVKEDMIVSYVMMFGTSLEGDLAWLRRWSVSNSV